MDDNYSSYRYGGSAPRRRAPRLFTIVAVVLTLSIVAGGVVLFLNGFSFKDLTRGKAVTETNAVTTPELTVWTVEVRDINTKIAAINQSNSIKAKGGAGYIRTAGEKWTVVEGVYLSSADATRQMMGDDATAGAVSDKVTIPARELSVPSTSMEAAKNVFSGIKNTFDTLVQKRAELGEGKITPDDVVLLANTLYAELKNRAAEIPDKDNAAVTNIMYVANTDALALYQLFIANRETNAFTSKLNTAIATLTFSLTSL